MYKITKQLSKQSIPIDRILNQKIPSIKDIESIYKLDFASNYQSLKLNNRLLDCISWGFKNQQLLKKIAENYLHKMKKCNIIDNKTKTLVHHHIILKCSEPREKKVRKI